MGCASSTNVSSEPSGASAMIDGVPVGSTPLHYEHPTVWVWTRTRVVLEKRGYHPTYTQLTAEVSTPYIILGIVCGVFTFFGFGFALIGEYRPNHHFILNPRADADEPELVEWKASPTVAFQ